MRSSVLFLLMAAAALAPAQTFLQPAGLAAGKGYTHVVITSPGRLAFISGQVAQNAAGQMIGKGDIQAQTGQAFENLKTALAAAGTSFDHVVKLTYFVRDVTPERLVLVREVRNRYVNPKAPPASSLIGAAALFHPDCLIEIEAVATVPDK
jgi:enamine deaminase RidA (YjgF/YER057c/UK114 family)